MPVSKNRRKSSTAERRKKNRMDRGIYNYPKVRAGASATPGTTNPLTELPGLGEHPTPHVTTLHEGDNLDALPARLGNPLPKQ